MLMGYHADSGGCATPGTIEIALDSDIIDLLLTGDVMIHQHLSLKEPVVLMRIIEALLVYLDITFVEQTEVILKKAHVFFI
jgi:hypothetical protein